jgi:hypothetical protein
MIQYALARDGELLGCGKNIPEAIRDSGVPYIEIVSELGQSIELFVHGDPEFDALVSQKKQRPGPAPTHLFTARLREKGYSVRQVAERWGLSERRLQEICANPSPMHLDALRGLPGITD